MLSDEITKLTEMLKELQADQKKLVDEEQSKRAQAKRLNAEADAMNREARAMDKSIDVAQAALNVLQALAENEAKREAEEAARDEEDFKSFSGVLNKVVAEGVDDKTIELGQAFSRSRFGRDVEIDNPDEPGATGEAQTEAA